MTDHPIIYSHRIGTASSKYEINDYELRQIHTKNIFATEVIVKEDTYNTLITKFKQLYENIYS